MNIVYTLCNLSLASSLLYHPLLKAWECQRVPSLGLGLGDLWPREPLGAEDDGEDGTLFCFPSGL